MFNNSNSNWFGNFDFKTNPYIQGMDFMTPSQMGQIDIGGTGSSWSDWFKDKGNLGMLQTGVGLLGGIGNAFMGMKQYGLAKKALSQQQDAFNKNYNAQKNTINTQYEDRQRARVASNPTEYESVDSYMKRNRIE